MTRTKLAVSYFGCRIPRHVKQDMQRLWHLGFERVIHTFSENDLFYFSRTMKDIVAISQDAGLEVQLDPWGVGGVFGGEAFSRWIIEASELAQRGPSGRPLGAACLNNPGLQERMREWIDAASQTGAEWIFWDEPHWAHRGPANPDGECCVCEHCRREAAALAEQGSGSHAMRDDFVQAPKVEIERFRARSMASFLKNLIRHAASRSMRSSICLLPQGTGSQPDLNWMEISRIPGVAEFGTDPYWQAFGVEGREQRDRFIDDNTSAAINASQTAGIQTMMWIQAFRVQGAQEDDLLAGTRRLLSHRPETVAVWGFEACAHMSSLACENPRRLWRRLVRLLGQHASNPSTP